MDDEEVDVNYIAGTPYVGTNNRFYAGFYAGPGGHMGEFTAWNPINGKAVWVLKDKFPFWSGALSTAGNVVFFGTMDGWFKAVDAVSGNELWKFRLGIPSSFRQLLTTDPYYRSTYVFVTRKSRALHLASFDDPRLRRMSVGVQVIGEEYAPAAISLDGADSSRMWLASRPKAVMQAR